MFKARYVATDIVGYCARYPTPPMSANPVPEDQLNAEDLELGNQFDTDETTKLADQVNEDWKRSCPEQWQQFLDEVENAP